MFFHSAYLEGHANNAHCLAAAVNAVLCALFALAGRRDTEERLKEFLAVRNQFFLKLSVIISVITGVQLASSSLLRLGQENDKEAIRNRESIYLLLDLVT